MIIVFSGKKFSGKDTAAEALVRHYKFKRIGLADKLKDICSEVFTISRVDMDDPNKKECLFEKKITISVENIHKLLQRVHEDGFEFNYEEIFGRVCKNFHGKILTSIRDMLQIIGTDIYRNFIKDDIWLEYIKKKLTHQDDIVITDARFKNERDYLKNIGAILVFVERTGFENKSSHISENQLGELSEYDVVVTNDSTIIALQSGIAMWYGIKKYELLSQFKR